MYQISDSLITQFCCFAGQISLLYLKMWNMNYTNSCYIFSHFKSTEIGRVQCLLLPHTLRNLWSFNSLTRDRGPLWGWRGGVGKGWQSPSPDSLSTDINNLLGPALGRCRQGECRTWQGLLPHRADMGTAYSIPHTRFPYSASGSHPSPSRSLRCIHSSSQSAASYQSVILSHKQHCFRNIYMMMTNQATREQNLDANP